MYVDTKPLLFPFEVNSVEAEVLMNESTSIYEPKVNAALSNQLRYFSGKPNRNKRLFTFELFNKKKVQGYLVKNEHSKILVNSLGKDVWIHKMEIKRMY